MDLSQTFYKVTNKEENHNGFQYVDGLNQLDESKEKFNDDPKASCCKGGLYFTTFENIHEYLGYGIFIREIMLPYEDSNFKMVTDLDGDKFRANKIILRKRYNLDDIKTIKKFKLENCCFDYACRNRYVNILDWLKTNKSVIKYTDLTIDIASRNGHVDVLEWFRKNNLEIKYTTRAINNAAKNGHVDVLEWFKKNNLEIRYTNDAIDYASRKGYVNVLDWFKQNNLEIKYTVCAIDWASENGHVNVLIWFKQNNLEIKYTSDAINWASENGHVNVLKWFEINK